MEAPRLKHFVGLLCTLIALAWLQPNPALAQDATPTAIPVATPASFSPQPTGIPWEAVPDLAEPVQFVVPQCDDCGGTPSILRPEPEQATPDDGGWFGWGDWFDIGFWFDWLIGGIWRMVQTLTCWLLFLLKILADMLAVMINLFVGVINELWRLFIFIWLAFRSVILVSWDVFQVLLSWYAWFLFYVFWVLEYARILLLLILEVIVVVLKLATLLLSILLRLLALLGWLFAIVLGMLAEFASALMSPDGSNGSTAYQTPAALTTGQGHPIYLGIRGIQEGVIASQIGWMIGLIHAMIWLSFLIWIVKFLPGIDSGKRTE